MCTEGKGKTAHVVHCNVDVEFVRCEVKLVLQRMFLACGGYRVAVDVLDLRRLSLTYKGTKVDTPSSVGGGVRCVGFRNLKLLVVVMEVSW